MRECLNGAKIHLWRLPNLYEPPPDYPGESKEMLVIIPLFQHFSDDDISLEHHLVRAALWARRSWICYSDLVDLDIGFKFYVENQVMGRVVPMLEENYVDASDILTMDGSDFEGNPRTHIGKKGAFLKDGQFREYDRVFQFDADMFMASNQRNKWPFFEKARTMPKEQIGMFTSGLSYEHLHIKNLVHWWEHCLIDGTEEDKQEEWFRRAATIVGNEKLQPFRDEVTPFRVIHGCMYAYPAKYFQMYRQADIEWLCNALQLLQQDEAVLSIFDDEVFDISKHIGLPIVRQIEEFADARESEDFGGNYISHISMMDHEWKWREHIDAL